MLVGNRYIKDTEPSSGDGTIAFGYQWLNSTNGNLYERNASNSAWVLVGNVNTSAMGLLPASGGAVTGAITGPTGWAALASPAFTGAPTKNGFELATLDDVTGSQTSVYDNIQNKVKEAVAATTSAINVKSKIAFSSGTLTPASVGALVTVPYPQFGDQTTGSASDYTWGVAIYSIPDQGNGLKKIEITNPGSGNQYTAVATRDDGVQTSVTLSYWIFGVKE